MGNAPLELTGIPSDPDLMREVAARYPPVGLTGVLADRGQRARPVAIRGSAAVKAYRWGLADSWTSTWWPQGIAVGTHEGMPLAMASWYAKPRRGREQGARISILDLREPRRPRYHHVLLVAARHRAPGDPANRTGADITFDPVVIHAGGIAWAGDRLLVAATFGGIHEFRLSDILRAPAKGSPRRPRGSRGYRHLLPQSATYRPADRRARGRMRYSFLGLETMSDAAGATSGDAFPSPAEGLRLIAGEYGTSDDRRLARLTLAGETATIESAHIPRITHMQGVALHDDEWFVSASRGDKRGGDLWAGTPGAMTRHEGVLPIGPEDLAVWPERNQLWSVSEYPGKRWIFGLELAPYRQT
jgi:hypothetical protein